MAGTRVGTVRGLWRYPVKSMLGEELAEADVAERGLAGDRAYALLAAATGRVVSAKNPKRWPRMFQLRASYVSRPSPGGPLPAVRIEFPDGTEVESGGPETEERLSGFLGGKVRLVTSTPERAAVEEYTPPIPGLEEGFGEFQIPPGPFHDSTPVHVVTTATLARLRDRYPEGRFDVRRFRPNVLLETDGQDIEGVASLGESSGSQTSYQFPEANFSFGTPRGGCRTVPMRNPSPRNLGVPRRRFSPSCARRG